MSGHRLNAVVVIPAYNEVRTIREVVGQTLAYADAVVVVDDGSTDGTSEALSGLCVTVLRHRTNLGKAAALRRGIDWAMTRGAEAIITLDGDGQHQPEDIPALLAEFQREPGAIVIGSRLHDPAAIPAVRYIGNRMARFWISLAAGQAIPDSQSGFRVYPHSVLQQLEVRCDWTADFVLESEVLIEAGRCGVPIRSVPISAVYGRPLRRSHYRQVADTWMITRMVTRKILAKWLTGQRWWNDPLTPPVRSRIQEAGRFSMRRGRRCVLFVAEAVTLAHVARTVTLARTLDPSKFEVHLACDARFLSLFGNLPPHVHPLTSIAGETFRARLRRGDSLYTVEELRSYVRQDLSVLTEVNPEAVVGDFRLSLGVSARVAGIPYFTITNAHWSPYARSRFIVPDLTLTERFGPRIGQSLFTLIRPFVFAQQAAAFNRIRKDYGLRAVPYSLLHVFTEADVCLYADAPSVVPTFKRPPHHHYVGPALWSPDRSPFRLDTLPSIRPLAYVSLGTSGRSENLPMVLQALGRLGFAGVVSTAGRRYTRETPPHVRCYEYLPGSKAAQYADVVVCNGGSATVYQALAAGVPVLGIPSNLDQYLMMSHVCRHGAGTFVRAGETSVLTIADAMDGLVRQGGYRVAAQRLQANIQHADGVRQLGDLLEADEYQSPLGGDWHGGRHGYRHQNTESPGPSHTRSVATLPRPPSEPHDQAV